MLSCGFARVEGLFGGRLVGCLVGWFVGLMSVWLWKISHLLKNYKCLGLTKRVYFLMTLQLLQLFCQLTRLLLLFDDNPADAGVLLLNAHPPYVWNGATHTESVCLKMRKGSCGLNSCSQPADNLFNAIIPTLVPSVCFGCFYIQFCIYAVTPSLSMCPLCPYVFMSIL